MQIYASSMRFPKGAREISINLKCCRPQGMPIIVIESNKPIIICTRAVYQPPHIIHIMLKSVLKQPASRLSLVTFLPNGQSTRPANLKHCSPHGMPIMVTHNTNPPITYPMAANRPPNNNHTKLPNKFMRCRANRSIFIFLI